MKKQRKLGSDLLKGGLALLALVSADASAANFALCAGEVTKTMPDGRQVKMWGYGLDGATCAPTIPGPRLTVPTGDNVLTISLRNTLPQAASVMIPGLGSTEAPVFFNDADGRRRVRSMVHETAPGATSSYTFIMKPGTYLYQSGTHSAVQVQMGLYGAATSDAAAGQAYPGVTYDNEVVVLYSEIDPVLHDAIAGATVDDPATAIDETVPTYGTPIGPSSTINYQARYFLVNGEPYSASSADLPAGNVGTRNLIRFLNAGLKNHAAVVLGERLSLVAEHGKPYTYVRDQYSALLAAGQTRDALFVASNSGRYGLYDRRLDLTNNAQAGDAGLMSHLAVAGATTGIPPVAVDDAATTPEDTQVVVNVVTNDTDADDGIDVTTVNISQQAIHGTAALAGGGSVSYTPNANFNGVDTFAYTIRDLAGNISNPATVTITVTPVNDAPVAVADAYNTTVDTVLNVAAPGVLQNDTDVDSVGLTASVTVNPAKGALVLNVDGSFVYTPNAGETGSDSFSYVASDGSLSSAEAQVTIMIAAPVNQAPVANDDYATVTKNSGSTNNVATVVVLANDSDADGTLDPATVMLTVNPSKGTATVNADGTITYRPRAGKTGADAFAYTVSDNQGAISNVATVRVDILR